MDVRHLIQLLRFAAKSSLILLGSTAVLAGDRHVFLDWDRVKRLPVYAPKIVANYIHYPVATALFCLNSSTINKAFSVFSAAPRLRVKKPDGYAPQAVNA